MKFFQPKDYQKHCEALFSRYKSKVQTTLPDAQIEHIGSSAVHGCISKGDLDIYVAIHCSQHESAIKKIQKLGFTIKQDTLRTENLCMLEDSYVAIQLVTKGSEFESFISFREALINDPELLKQYNQLKLNCAGFTMKEYRKEKSLFIEYVLLQNYNSSPQFRQ